MDKSSLPLFQQKQYEFTAHIRDPKKNALPKNVEDRRMNIYRDLLFNNIVGFVGNGFPVLKTFYTEEQWLGNIRQFFAQTENHSPYFKDIPEQYLNWLENDYQTTEIDPPFMLELAQYELVELILDVSEEHNELGVIDPNGDLFNERPVISSLVWLLSYQWPVHLLDADEYNPTEKPEQPTYLIVFRDRNDSVEFVESNPVTARLLDILQNNDQLTGEQALMQIAQEMQHPQPETVIEGGLQTLQQFQQIGIILGTQIIDNEQISKL